jgi:hypothetical protein
MFNESDSKLYIYFELCEVGDIEQVIVQKLFKVW